MSPKEEVDRQLAHMRAQLIEAGHTDPQLLAKQAIVLMKLAARQRRPIFLGELMQAAALFSLAVELELLAGNGPSS